MELNFASLIAAVFGANMLTAAFIWGMSRMSRVREEDLDWIVYAAVLMPLGAFILSLIGGGALPQSLAAMLPR